MRPRDAEERIERGAEAHVDRCPSGFELGSGLFVSNISPEDAAAQLRAFELD